MRGRALIRVCSAMRPIRPTLNVRADGGCCSSGRSWTKFTTTSGATKSSWSNGDAVASRSTTVPKRRELRNVTMVPRFETPPFEPHPLLRNRHAQTLAGVYLPGGRYPYRAVHYRVVLPDGDAIVLHDDIPEAWQAGGRVALLIHGLAGCHTSPYMVRVAAKLNAVGVRTFRMDLRGCGSGEGLAALPYHAGRSDDAMAALEFIGKLCPQAPVALVGFSLSGNIVLKLLGEAPGAVPANVTKAAAICPAIDLGRCVRSLVGPFQRAYDRYFVRVLSRQIHTNTRLRPDVVPLKTPRRMRSIFDFDDFYTGPVCGFGSADNYYASSSAARL